MNDGGKGWHGAPFVPPDGQNWPVSIAASMLDIPEQDIRDAIRILNNAVQGAIEPAGVVRVNTFSRQGRQPRAYPGKKLIDMCEGLRKLAQDLAES